MSFLRDAGEARTSQFVMSEQTFYSRFRAGYALAVADELTKAERIRDDAFLAALLVRCWIDLGQFRHAGEVARDLGQSSLIHKDGQLVISAYGQLATVLHAPAPTHRHRLRHLSVELQGSEDSHCQAVGWKCEGCLIAIEVAFQIRPMTDQAEAISCMESAINCYRRAKLTAEVLDEAVSMANIIRKGPFPDPKRAAGILRETLREAEFHDDAVAMAEVQRILCEIDLEQALQHNDQEVLATMQGRIESVASLYIAAGFNAGEAAVIEAVGRQLLRFNRPEGVPLLSEAAERWHGSGRAGWADAVWSELITWHMHRGEMNELVALQERRRENTSLQTEMKEQIGTLTDAFEAINLGDFANVNEILERAISKAATPGQEAGILLQQARALEAQGRICEAARNAELAVELLRPAKPCAMLSEALFHLGMYQSNPDRARQLFTDAAEAAEECGLTADAARHWMNLGQSLHVAVGQQTLNHDPEAATEYFLKSERLLQGKLDRESIVLQGNLAQRRGQVAFFGRDFKGCGVAYSKAELYYRTAEQNVDLAFILAQQALALFDLARQSRSCESWQQVIDRFDEASDRFEKQGLRAESVRLSYLSGSALFESHWLYPTEGQRAEKLAEAHRRLENAALAMETLRSGRKELNLLSSMSSLEQFAATQLKVYEQGLRICAGFLKQSDHAFLWLERMKARAALDGLARTQLAAPLGFADKLAECERVLETQRQELPEDDPTTPTRWLSLSRSLDEVWAKMEKVPALSSYGRIRRGRPVTWSDWRVALEREANRPETNGRNFLTVHFHWPQAETAHQKISIIGCRADWKTPELAEVDVDLDLLARFARMCFQAPEGGNSPLRTMLPVIGGDSVWQSRFSELLSPLSSWCHKGDIVGVFPHGTLHGLPLSTLLVDGQPLAERNSVFFSPSASVQHLVWERASRRPPPDAALDVAVFGCSLASGSFLGLPRARDEAEFVAQLAALQATPVLDSNVSRKNVFDALPNADIVHFVGHGFESSDGWSSGLQLADNEKVTALELYEIQLRADLVTLSGCRTGCKRWRPGDETVGLVPALLQAGASSLLASSWEVRERPTELLMQHFYDHVYGSKRVSKADALRHAVEVVRREFVSLADWGAFHLHGNWR